MPGRRRARNGREGRQNQHEVLPSPLPHLEEDGEQYPVRSDLQSDRFEYKHLKCDLMADGIENPYIRSCRIANPAEQAT